MSIINSLCFVSTQSGRNVRGIVNTLSVDEGYRKVILCSNRKLETETLHRKMFLFILKADQNEQDET